MRKTGQSAEAVQGVSLRKQAITGGKGLPPAKSTDKQVFLNCPCDEQFLPLFLACVAGICAFGLVPRTTLEIPGGERLLNRIIGLIRSCRYSFHDLSRVERDSRRPATPRFNMPFELGLTVMAAAVDPNGHTWFAFESTTRRMHKSLSDLGGTDEYVHGGVPHGVLHQIGNALVQHGAPNLQSMLRIHRTLERNVPRILKRTGAASVFEAWPFNDLVWLARGAAKVSF